MAFHRPGLPRNRRPRARARGLPTGVARCGSCWPCWLCWVFGSLGRGSGGWALTGISVTRGVGGALAARRVWRVGLASWPSTTQALRTGMLSEFHLRGAWYRVLAGCGAMAQLVARLHGMQKVRGSNSLSSTIFRIPVRRKSAKPLALDQGLTWANAQSHIDALHADGRGARTGLIVQWSR